MKNDARGACQVWYNTRMTLPQRIALVVQRCMALLHPCAYGELVNRDSLDVVKASLEKEIGLLCPGRDAKATVAEFMASPLCRVSMIFSVMEGSLPRQPSSTAASLPSSAE